MYEDSDEALDLLIDDLDWDASMDRADHDPQQD